MVFHPQLDEIGLYAFRDCTALTNIWFGVREYSYLASESFAGVAATASYPSGDATWTSAVMQNYGGTITWTAR